MAVEHMCKLIRIPPDLLQQWNNVELPFNKNLILFSILPKLALIHASAFADDVVILTEENFEKEVGQDRGALVEFYAPWCGQVKSLHQSMRSLEPALRKQNLF